MRNTEIEFKYPAEGIKLENFHDFCLDAAPDYTITATGFDHFYSKKDDPNSFYRHRINGTDNELTFKRKIVENNVIREEHNVDLAKTVDRDKIKDFCKIQGYDYNTSVFKHCWVYFYECHVISYYVCYDDDLQELGRFIEIEANEAYAWANEEVAYSHLLLVEKIARKIGVRSENRIKESLFEMYRRKE